MQQALRFQRSAARQPYLFAVLLLAVTVLVNLQLQPDLLEAITINRNFRVFLPLMVLVVGQTIVIIGGGIDLSAGSIVTLGNAILATAITSTSTPQEIWLAILAACLAGVAAGMLNGLCVAYLRLQPIVTTYATSFIFTGAALLVLPRPGGDIPSDLSRLYRSAPGDIPLTLYMVALLAVFWLVLRTTRYAQFLYATGGKAEAAYFTGVPVNRVRFTTYMWSGLFAALAALALTLSTASGSPRSGDAMTLQSIVAVVLGGTRLSGGQGGVIGSLVGAAALGLFNNIVSFANVSPLAQDLAKALIILVALVGPGVARLARRLATR